jgi:hypothetical protein
MATAWQRTTYSNVIRRKHYELHMGCKQGPPEAKNLHIMPGRRQYELCLIPQVSHSETDHLISHLNATGHS